MVKKEDEIYLIYKQILESGVSTKERTKFALSLSAKGIVICPVICILSDINPKVYYSIFKKINQGKLRNLKELENNFIGLNIELF